MAAPMLCVRCLHCGEDLRHRDAAGLARVVGLHFEQTCTLDLPAPGAR